MPDDGSIAPWAAATSASIDNLSSYAAVNQTNKKSRQWNEKMYAQQRADALSDWEMQNKYNHPAQQMARLHEAGLNPNLVYGSGGATSESKTVAGSSVASWNPQVPTAQFRSPLAAYNDMEMRNAQLKNLEAQNASIVAATVSSLLGSEGKQIKNKMALDLSAIYPQLLQAGYDKTINQISAMQQTWEQNQEKQPYIIKSMESAIANLDARTATEKEKKEQVIQAVNILKQTQDFNKFLLRLQRGGISKDSPWFIKLFGNLGLNLIED